MDLSRVTPRGTYAGCWTRDGQRDAVRVRWQDRSPEQTVTEGPLMPGDTIRTSRAKGTGDGTARLRRAASRRRAICRLITRAEDAQNWWIWTPPTMPALS